MTSNKRQKNGREQPKTVQEASVAKETDNSQGRPLSPGSSGGPEAGQGEIGAERAKRLTDVPAKYRKLYRRAWSGKSRKAAIRAFCLECVYWSEKEVRLCTAPACPLFEFREKG